MTGTLISLAAVPQGTSLLGRTLPVMVTRVFLCGALFASLGALVLAGPWQPAGASTPTPGFLPLVQAAAAVAQKQRVMSEGVVQAIRELAAESANGARQFEMTIRMRDGTMRVSHETGGARWRAGDPIQLIGMQAGAAR